MKSLIAMCAAALALSACQQSSDTNAAAEKGEAASASATDATICDRYFAFVENYAAKQQAAVKDALLKRLDYDKQSLPTRDKQEADEYCTQSLARMERMAG
jgi:protein involved in sex pheromone biosynthesis